MVLQAAREWRGARPSSWTPSPPTCRSNRKAAARSWLRRRSRAPQANRGSDNSPSSHPLPLPFAETIEELAHEPERISRVRVERQAYIHAPKAMLSSIISSQEGLSPKQRLGLKRVLACLESIYGVEYQLAGDQLVQILHRLNRAAVVPPGVKLVASMDEEADQMDWDDEENNWNREMPSLFVEVKPGIVYMSEDEADALERRFLEGFMALLGKSHFIPVSPRDGVMADTLNTSYLAQLFIRPNLNRVDSEFGASRAMDPAMTRELGGVAVFKRGWGKEKTTGQLLAPKLDFVQSLIAKSIVRVVEGPVVAVISMIKGGVKAVPDAAQQQRLSEPGAPSSIELEPPVMRSAGPLMVQRGVVAALRPLQAGSATSEEPRKGLPDNEAVQQRGAAGSDNETLALGKASVADLRLSAGPLVMSRGTVSALRPQEAQQHAEADAPAGDAGSDAAEALNGTESAAALASADINGGRPALKEVEPLQRPHGDMKEEQPHGSRRDEAPKRRRPGSRVLRSLRNSLEYYGLLPPSDKVELSDFEEQFPVREASRHSPVYVERVAIEDCFGAAGQPAGLQTIKAALEPKTLFGQVELVEPTFREVLVICRPKTPTAVLRRARRSINKAWVKLVMNQDIVEKPVRKERLHMRVYKDIPVPVWRIVHPFKAIAFRPISMLKVDLVALAGLVAILAQAKYGSPLLSLVWIASLLVQGLRVVLQYRRMFIQFDNYVSKQMLNRTVAGADGVPEFLARSAALQQYKQVLLLYYTLVANSADLLLEPEAAVKEIELILSTCGCEVDFNMTEAKAELLRLGLLRFSQKGRMDGSGPVYEVLMPEEAVERLKAHWNSILTDQLENISASSDEAAAPEDFIPDSIDSGDEDPLLSTYSSY